MRISGPWSSSTATTPIRAGRETSVARASPAPEFVLSSNPDGSLLDRAGLRVEQTAKPVTISGREALDDQIRLSGDCAMTPRPCELGKLANAPAGRSGGTRICGRAGRPLAGGLGQRDAPGLTVAPPAGRATTLDPMIVPLTLGDFLERAEIVYGERVAVVDEPNPPGGGLGRFTYAQFGADGAQPGGRARRPGRGPERARRHRVAQRRALPGEPVRRQRLRPHPGAGELPAQRRGDPLHPRALRRHGAAGRSGARRAAARHPGQAPHRARRPRATRSSSCARAPRRSCAWPTRTPPRRSTTRRAPPRGPRACSSRTATAGSTRSPSAGTWP